MSNGSSTPVCEIDAPCSSLGIWFLYNDGTINGAWRLRILFNFHREEDVEGMRFCLIDPTDRDALSCMLDNPIALYIWNNSYYLPGQDFDAENLAESMLTTPGATDAGDGLGDAYNYFVGCGDENPDPSAEQTYPDAGCGALSVYGCPPGYYYDALSESCKPICGFLSPYPCTPPIPVQPPTSPCPDGSQPPCVGHRLDPPLPLASDGVGFSAPSNVALPVHPTVSQARIFEVCGACGKVDESEEEL